MLRTYRTRKKGVPSTERTTPSSPGGGGQVNKGRILSNGSPRVLSNGGRRVIT